MFWNTLIYPELSLEAPGVSSLLDLRAEDDECPEFVACLCLDGYADLPVDRKPDIIANTADAIVSALPETYCKRLGFTHTNAFYFCGSSESIPSAKLIETLDATRCAVASSSGLGATLGIAFVRERTTAGFQHAAQFAVVAQRRKIQLGAGATYVYEKSFLSTTFSLSIHWRLSQQLNGLVRASDPAQVNRVLAQVSAVLFGENYLPLNSLRPILQSYVILMAQSARDAGAGDDEITAETQEYVNRIAVTYDYTDLKGILEEVAHSFTQHVRNRFHCASSRMTSRADEIIRASLADPDLALHAIARTMDVNASYLSRRFKQEKGIGLSSYISVQRVDWAKRLLLDRKLSITQISHDVGFGSTQNFGRVFRSIEGCSPSEYRAKLPR